MIFSQANLWDKMRALLLSLGSALLTFGVIGNAYYQKKQFYPSVVYITKSNPSMAVIYLQAFVLVLLMGKLMRKIFFGQLRAAEMEHLIERSWYAVTETCLAFTVFRDDFSPKFVALFTLLLFLKCFHWLAEDRVDYMERSPIISLLFHVRVISLLLLLGMLDFIFVTHAYQSTISNGASVQLVFGFEYAILLIVVQNIFIKYVLHSYDLQSENPWENKAVFLLYSELVMGFCKVVLYLSFMIIMIKIHTFPLFAIRPMYLSMRAFKKAVNDVIMSRRAIRNMNTLYPDATPEELARADNVCIICREEMSGGGSSKKLPCNHIFHASCLRSWFQRQQTCPTCRMDVLHINNPSAQPAQANVREAQPPPPPNNANWPFIPGVPFPFFVPPIPQPPPAEQPPAQSPVQQPSRPTAAASATTTASILPQQAPSISQTNASHSTTESTASSNLPITSTGAPPFMPPFPFMPFLFPPPPPPPAADLSALSPEELKLLEGQERENVEARIRCLRNIQTLLDGAVMQMQQYSTIVASLKSNSSLGSQETQTTACASHTKSNSSMNGDNSAVDGESSTSEQDEVRRRRLQRFQGDDMGQLAEQ